jgi:hypothetical protein
MDPLWRVRLLQTRAARPSGADRAAILTWLDQVEANAAAEQKKEYPWSRVVGQLDGADLERALTLAERLIDARGSGISLVLESLLAMIALSGETALTAFWERVALPRHQFGRRDTSATLRARIACWWLREGVTRGRAGASAALERLLPSLQPAMRGEELLVTVDELLQEHPARAQPFVALAERVASEDGAFEARYLARCALHLAGKPIPTEKPQTVVRFALSVGGFSCALELLAADTLVTLHDAIQAALGWDDDHLWCLYLNGDRRDRRFVWSPDGEVGPLECIGELGLRPGNKLLYHFDFGDNHLIPLRVARIEPAKKAAKKAAYPRIVAKGRRPQQDSD